MSIQPSQQQITAACAAIYRHWRRYLSHNDALEQAAGFKRRAAEVANENDREFVALVGRFSEIMGERA